MTATVRVPGKLYIAGEYAVLRPGGAAILVAVDRTITATARLGVAVDTDAGTVTSAVTGGVAVPWTRRGATVELGAEYAEHAEHLTYVRAALAIAGRYVAEAADEGTDRSRADGTHPGTPSIALDIASEMTDGGVKLGLGSSGAVTVATVAAVLSARGVAASPALIYRLSMLAAVTVDPHGSGGDLAAASHGGWVLYRSPDRAALRRRLDAGEPIAAIVAAAWTGHLIEPLPAPPGLELRVGWTGTPASTAAHVSRLQQAGAETRIDLSDFHSGSDRCVAGLAAALRAGDRDRFLGGIRAARGLLDGLARRTGMGIVTEELAALCSSAEALGAAAKSSGAGGGDCGIAFTAQAAGRALLDEAWRRVGVRPLDIGIRSEPVEVTP